MVNRETIIDDMQQLATSLTEMAMAEETGTLQSVDYHRWLVGLHKAVWHIMEFLVRKGI